MNSPKMGQQAEYLKHLDSLKKYLDSGNSEICDKFTEHLGDHDTLCKTFKALDPDLFVHDRKRHDRYIQNLNRLGEKNFCRLLFSVYIKFKYGKECSLSDAENNNNMKRLGRVSIILAGALVLSAIMLVLIASVAPSLLLFIASLIALYCTYSILNSFFKKKEIAQESDRSKQDDKNDSKITNDTKSESDAQIVVDCIDECLSRDLADSILDFAINLFPGKSLCAKMPGPVGKFFDNTQKTKPKGEAEFIMNIILENIGVMIFTTVMTQMFAAITGFGAAAGTLAALGMIFALTQAVYKVVHGLFLYDTKQTNEEKKELETQRERYFEEYGQKLMQSNQGDDVELEVLPRNGKSDVPSGPQSGLEPQQNGKMGNIVVGRPLPYVAKSTHLSSPQVSGSQKSTVSP